jgi:long-chain acyl-CoA synthetase
MNPSVINAIVASRPSAEHRITFWRLDGSTSMTLTELHADAEKLARALYAEGIRPGDRIGIIAANCPEWVLLDLAALRLKAVTAGFEPGKFEPGQVLDRYELSALFTDRADEGRPIATVRDLIAAVPDTPPLPVPYYNPRDITTVKFTSGSTGEPKGLGATAGSIDSSITAVQGMFHHGSGDNLFVFLPLSLLQQRYWIYSALRFGHDVTISTYEAAFPALRRADATVVMGVPAFYETVRRYLDKSGMPARQLFGPKIRYLWTGSAPARPSTLRFFNEAGLPIYEGYGLNEACIVAKNHPGAHREGSVGQVLPGKKVLFDPDGRISIWCEYPVNTRYEYAAPGESERVFAADGMVLTSDIGYLDDDGFLYIRGRADDMIALENGRNVFVRPLEEFLAGSRAIDECVVLAQDSSSLAAVISAADDPPDEDAIHARVAEANAAFSTDERIGRVIIAPEPFSVDNGMLTSQFKPRRRRIAERYLPRLEAATDVI